MSLKTTGLVFIGVIILLVGVYLLLQGFSNNNTGITVIGGTFIGLAYVISYAAGDMEN